MMKINKSPSKDSDVNISKENQKKINLFAIRNGWLDELKEKLSKQQNSLKNLEDASDEIMLLDESESVPIMIGESFVHFDQSRAVDQLATLKSTTQSQITKIQMKINVVKVEMATLKAELYGQFGDSINLECGDEEDS